MTQPTPPLAVTQAAIGTLVDAIDDTHNALGQTDWPAKVQSYGNLVPDILRLAGQSGAMPGDLAAMPQSTRDQLAAAAAEQLKVPHADAWTVVSQVLTLFANVITTVLADSTGIAALIKAIR